MTDLSREGEAPGEPRTGREPRLGGSLTLPEFPPSRLALIFVSVSFPNLDAVSFSGTATSPAEFFPLSLWERAGVRDLCTLLTPPSVFNEFLSSSKPFAADSFAVSGEYTSGE